MGTEKLKTPKQVTGYGYVGQWFDGTLGWFGVRHISAGGRRYAEPPNSEAGEHAVVDERFFLCKVTLTPILDKKGRPITRIVKPKRAKQ